MTDEEITLSIKDHPMMHKDRKGKPFDPEFAEWLYQQYFGDKKIKPKQIRKPRKKKS